MVRNEVVVAALCVVSLFGVCVSDATDLPSVEAVMEELHISESDQQRIREGKIADWSTGEATDRELALGMALLVKIKPHDLAEMYRQGLGFQKVSVITAHGQIVGEGTLADFAGVTLQPNPEKEARRYLEVEPGSDLNLDAKEMATFRALKGSGEENAVPVQKVEAAVRQLLLDRYQAYRTKGLLGIAPYERGGGRQRRAGDELLQSTKELTAIARHAPLFHNFLLSYPQGLSEARGKGLEEFFYWLNIDIFGRPTYVLVHRMLVHAGQLGIAIERQYYTSHDYNSMLQGIAAIPTRDGMFLFYVGRVSTDQVAGFGSSAKHPISRAIAAPYIKDMFKMLQTEAEKQKSVQ